jgi:hypothetical protein
LAHAALARRLAKLEQRSDPKRRGGVIHIPPDVTAEKLDEFTSFFKRQCEAEGLDASAFVLVPETASVEMWPTVVRQQLAHVWKHSPLTPGGDHGAI